MAKAVWAFCILAMQGRMETVRLSSKGWKILALILGVIAVAAIVGLSRREETVGVLTAQAAIGDIDNRVTTNGSVVPISEFQARANFPGIVEKVYVELGDRIHAGQMLVSMKDPFAAARITGANSALALAQVGQRNIQNGGTPEELITSAGDVEHARQAQAQAQHSLAALKQLQQQGAASAAEVDAAQRKLDDADTTLATLEKRMTGRFDASDAKSARERVVDAEANLQSAKIQFDNANIASPMSGTVYAVQVSPWDFVPMGADLVRVADLKNVEIRAYFDEPEIGKLKAGQPVTIRWDGRPGREWHGHIKQAPVAAVALGPRSVGECVITVDDAKEDLLPNTNVMVTATIQRHMHVLTVPRTALYVAGQSYVVYRVVDGRLRRTPVQTGIINLDRAEIAGGLAPGDTVALNTVDNRALTDGLSVRAVAASQPRPGLLNYMLRLMR